MDHLRTEIADLLSRHGRIPPGEAKSLAQRAVNLGRDRAWFQAEVKRVAASDPELAAKRELVRRLALRARLAGRDFDVAAEVENALAEARDAGWNRDDFREIVQALADEAIPDPPSADAAGTPNRPRGRAIVIGAVAAAVAIVIVAAAWLSANPFGSETRSPNETGSAAGELNPVLEGLRFAAAHEGALDEEILRLLDRLDEESIDAVVGPMTPLILRRALREAEPSVWEAVSGTSSIAALERFVSVYPDGRFSGEASAMLDDLREERTRAALIRRVQNQMIRLGRDVEATGVLDARTAELLADLSAAFDEPGSAEVSRELIERLQARDEWPRRPGEVFRDCAACPELVAIPGGRFLMGSPEEEQGSEPNERPVREVAVPGFALARTEVTFEQWASCVDEGGCSFIPPDAGWGQGRRPVVNVAWSDALTYLRWLSDKTGHAYRLPSEAEWEYAARAGTTTRFHTGRCITSEAANFDGRLPEGGCPPSEARRRTVPVASFPPNAFGLFDMAGNVRELTRDCWNEDYRGAPVDGSAWMSGDCSRPVLRGGSWRGSERAVRSANRTRPSGAFIDAETGFRPARDLEGDSIDLSAER